jgi:hypothetical protein
LDPNILPQCKTNVLNSDMIDFYFIKLVENWQNWQKTGKTGRKLAENWVKFPVKTVSLS